MPIFLDAAYKVLRDTDHSLFADEITKFAIERSLLKTRGATPAATMAASLYVNIRDKGTASRFIQIGPNQFTLNEKWESQSEPEPKRNPQMGRIKKKAGFSKTSPVHEFINKEISFIQAFLNGKNEQLPTSEKICDWVNLCYSLGIYIEGAELFSYVDATEVNEWYYERTKKMARLCYLHRMTNNYEK